MVESVSRESQDSLSKGVLGDAVWRLDQALAKLDGRRIDPADAVAETQAEAIRAALTAAMQRCDSLESEKSELITELDTARDREMALMDAAAAASDVLGRAGLEVRAALGQGLDTSEEEAA